MIHSILIVGGTKNKRSRASEEKSFALKTPSERSSGESLAERPQKFDTTTLEPEEDKQTISIDQIRDLQHQLSLKPYAAKFKTGVILEAQRMTVEAQNALLKTLEEPPAHSVLILTAPSTRNLLPTIVSRCQIVRLKPEIDLDLESEEHQQAAQEFLQLLWSGRPARQRVAAGESGGGERLQWIEDNKSTISNLPAGKAGQQSAINNLNIWISVLRDLLLIKSGCQSLTLNPLNGSSNSSNSSNSQKFPPNLTTILQSMNIPTETLADALQNTIKTKHLIATTNVSPRLALEVLLLDLPIL